ncbi:MAG TPA: beta-L-arabinofuranosidase domain-containing protein, partial [Croceibacterium sp.]|nr:beta-L-arabinofuranosidase domain-containing protein [Croceibacterium sp.]
MRLSRRTFLASTAASALLARGAAAAKTSASIAPAPLTAVRLLGSPWQSAVERNRRTLASYDPERLLHNFYRSAGLPAPKPVYGGWEARGIAGHTLGHYMSALSLIWAQTGDEAARSRLSFIVAELARVQQAHGDGYIGGTTVERSGQVVDGKIVFEELRRGEIRTSGFDVNGGWVPLYTWHKVQAGLIDAVQLAGIDAARPVLLGMAGYLATILEGLDDAALQRLLDAESGGLNESYADTYALTGDPRWLRLAERLRHRRVLDPLAAGRDQLQGLHANTQIPKVLGVARLHELTGNATDAATARFFRGVVMRDHSYVIGGNSEREHFGPPGDLAGRVTERTCEACNSYNMLKLTRRLWSWAPEGALFDDYERIHLNHILGQQHPETGMFNYFMPLSAGAKRLWSTREDSFWCCMGSGMESHAKHGDSIWWGDGETLWVNLFIASALDWTDAGWKARLR